MFGFLNINKPTGCTSRDAVDSVKRLVRPAKVGHAGTLDPLATGVLVVCIGPATRLAQYVQRMPKSYVADFRLGFESDTEDCLGNVVPIPKAPIISQNELEAVLSEFVGVLNQRPPQYSALKIDGRRAYKLARAGKQVELQERPIMIHGIRLTRFQFPDFQLEIECGSGTYVRSLGRDIGKRLGSAAIMTNLLRSAIGNFKVDNGCSSVALTHALITDQLIPPQRGLNDIERVTVPNEQLAKFANGCPWCPQLAMDADDVLAIDQSHRLLAILKRRESQLYTPKLNFSKYWIDHLNQ